MALEEQIIEWAATRPVWQRLILKRIAAGDPFSSEEYATLVDELIADEVKGDSTFDLDEFPQTETGDPPTTLIAINDPEHVNALESEDPLGFEQSGLTIVYGDNGSGKSGYARLLKQVTRARHQEDVLSDVFRDTSLAKPTAKVTIGIDEEEKTIDWPGSTVPELQRVHFYDDWCARAYIDTESDFPYRPSALFVMDGLIEACVEIRSLLEVKLEENAKTSKRLPAVDEELQDTEIGEFLIKLSGSTTMESLDGIFEKNDESAESIDDLKEQESRLQSKDTTKEKKSLTRRSEKLEALRLHVEGLQSLLCDDEVKALEEERDRVKSLKEASALLAKAFKSEPVTGVGTTSWKELWESARRFSEGKAYTDDAFPVISDGAVCVLCQQSLSDDASDRLSRFESFVKNDTQTQLASAQTRLDGRLTRLGRLKTSPDAVESNLKDLEPQQDELVQDTRELLSKYESIRVNLVEAVTKTGDLPRSSIAASQTVSRLEKAATAANTEAENLSDPETVKQRKATVTKRRKELELLKIVKEQRGTVSDEIERLKERVRLEEAKSAASTTGLTKKILELSEDNITEVVRDTFTRETDRLHLERVTIAKTRGARGALLHQPKLVGARQDVTLPRVFSEGERTALGLAAFFTEAHLDASKSAIILDDPVSSLDHVRRGLVAGRLATLAQSRQVIVFTHDVSFVADLKREARGASVSVAERSVSRARGGEKKPGVCSEKHPWKAKDVPERFNELKRDLAHIKKESEHWDDDAYEKEISDWAGRLSETWERIFSQEIVGLVLAEGGVEVRPNMVKLLTKFSKTDEDEFQASYSRVSQWATRHDKSVKINYVAPEIDVIEKELTLVEEWFKRVKRYKN